MACVLGLVVYVGLSSLYVNPGLLREGYGSGYQIELEKMVQAARAWVDWLNRDFLYLVPLLVLAVLRLGRLRPRLSEAARWAAWLVLWFALYLPWKFAPEYYLLPFAVGAALLGALLVSVLRQVVVHEKGGWRAAAAAVLVLSGLLFVLTLPNNYTNGRLQLAIDSANAEMLDEVVEGAPPNAVVLLNHPEGGEYSVHFPSLVTERGGRSDLTVAVFRSQDPKAEGWEGKTILVILPVFENQFYPSVRLGVFAHDAARWNEGRVPTWAPPPARPSRATQRFRLFNVDAARLFCPAAPQLRLLRRAQHALRPAPAGVRLGDLPPPAGLTRRSAAHQADEPALADRVREPSTATTSTRSPPHPSNRSPSAPRRSTGSRQRRPAHERRLARALAPGRNEEELTSLVFRIAPGDGVRHTRSQGSVGGGPGLPLVGKHWKDRIDTGLGIAFDDLARRTAGTGGEGAISRQAGPTGHRDVGGKGGHRAYGARGDIVGVQARPAEEQDVAADPRHLPGIHQIPVVQPPDGFEDEELGDVVQVSVCAIRMGDPPAMSAIQSWLKGGPPAQEV